MTDDRTLEVKAALRRLALGEAPPGTTPIGADADSRDLLAEAEAAVEDIRRAADLASEGDFECLRQVATAGTATRDSTVATRAEEVLAAIDAYREVARSVGRPDGDGNHFRPGHDGLIRGAGVPSDDE